MEPMSFINLSIEHRRVLLDLARRAGTLFLATHTRLNIQLAEYAPCLAAPGACFVTLKNASNALRGCVGSLDSCRPLVTDVAENTIAAATRDARFPAMSKQDFNDCIIEISILTPQEKIPAENKTALFGQLRPREHGVVVDDGIHRATFLPKVWQQLESKDDFYQHLMQKAGLAPHYWSRDLCFYRYHSIDFSEKDFQ